MPTPAAAPGPLAGAGPIRQCAYVAPELEPAVAWWTALGVGPFYAMHEQRMQGYVHRGEPVEPVLTIAFANSAELQIELIVPHDDTPSPFREALDAGQAGAHHLAWWVEDWDGWERSAAAAGWTPTTAGDGGGMAHFAYYDTGGPLIAEVMELNDLTRWMTDKVRTAHHDWDGRTDPLRPLF
jgi:glyoxalase/bleomycin resistance protein/dioxygenase superfamily protein